MFETSVETDKLDAALAKAQGEINLAITDHFNPAFRYKYADLASIWEACRAPLTKHGINVTQWPLESDNGKCILLTRIAHGGQWMRAVWAVPVAKQDPQGYGSALTYIKRYSLSAILGITKGEEDDDGNAASGIASHPKPAPSGKDSPISPKVSSLVSRLVTEDEAKHLRSVVKSKGINPAEFGLRLKTSYGVSKCDELNDLQYKELISDLALG